MTVTIELAKQCGIRYFATPDGTTEMWGTDRQIEAFAEAVRVVEREACALVCEALLGDAEADRFPQYSRNEMVDRCIDAIRERNHGR